MIAPGTWSLKLSHRREGECRKLKDHLSTVTQYSKHLEKETNSVILLQFIQPAVPIAIEEVNDEAGDEP